MQICCWLLGLAVLAGQSTGSVSGLRSLILPEKAVDIEFNKNESQEILTFTVEEDFPGRTTLTLIGEQLSSRGWTSCDDSAKWELSGDSTQGELIWVHLLSRSWVNSDRSELTLAIATYRSTKMLEEFRPNNNVQRLMLIQVCGHAEVKRWLTLYRNACP